MQLPHVSSDDYAAYIRELDADELDNEKYTLRHEARFLDLKPGEIEWRLAQISALENERRWA